MIKNDYYLTPHFRYKELACKHCGRLPQVSREVIKFLWMLEEFRSWYRKPMNLNCGYRCSDYNKQVKGSKISLHLCSLAVDWGIRGITDSMGKGRLSEWRNNVVNKWKELGNKYKMYIEVEINPTWIHLGATNSERNYSRVGIANGAKENNFNDYFSERACYDRGRYE